MIGKRLWQMVKRKKGEIFAVSVATMIVGLTIVPVSANCGGGSNYYAEETDTNTNGGAGLYGIHGYITVPSSGPNVPQNTNWFSDESIHISAYSKGSTGEDGLEVGWFVGTGANGVWYNVPTLYATYNGAGEVDGPSVARNTDYWYSTAVDKTTNDPYWKVYSGSTQIWALTGSAYVGNPNGWPRAMGETNVDTIPMGPATISGLQDYAGSWANWPGMTPCEDATYVVNPDTPSSQDYCNNYGPS